MAFVNVTSAHYNGYISVHWASSKYSLHVCGFIYVDIIHDKVLKLLMVVENYLKPSEGNAYENIPGDIHTIESTGVCDKDENKYGLIKIIYQFVTRCLYVYVYTGRETTKHILRYVYF